MLIGLLEDDLAIQEMLSLLLHGEGHEVATYVGAEECMTDLRIDDPQAGAFCPDLLMIDLHLARSVSGITVIERIRANPRLENLPVVLMTASVALDKQELQRLRAGLLVKPFNIDEVIQLVDELAGPGVP